MKVSELAAELGVPASVLLERCNGSGIDAESADAELGESDVARLRAEPEAAPGLPPTAAGSIPGFGDVGAPVAPTTRVTSEEAPPEQGRRFDRRAGSAVTAVGVAVVAFVVANQLTNAYAIVALWLVGLVALVGCLVAGRRSVHRSRIHGDRYWGGWLAPLAMVVAVLGLAGLATAVYAAVRDEPAADAPMGIGEYNSVQRVRWGYRRIVVVKDNGWAQPVKVVGSCWNVSSRARDQDNRPAERIEVGNVSVNCKTDHTVEVLDAFNVSRDPDAPYPGQEALVGSGQNECGDDLERAREALGLEANQVTMLIEVPTEDGWDAGDHSVACVAVTPERRGSLFSEG